MPTIPTLAHINGIMALNEKYLMRLNAFQQPVGFIRIAYSQSELQRIVEAREIVIATNNNEVVAYYLIGKKSGNERLEYQRQKALALSENNAIAFEQIGYGCQVCIDEKYRNNGLFGEMLRALANNVRGKYTRLLCSVSEENKASFSAHIANNWKNVDNAVPFNGSHFLIYKIHPNLLE